MNNDAQRIEKVIIFNEQVKIGVFYEEVYVCKRYQLRLKEYRKI